MTATHLDASATPATAVTGHLPRLFADTRYVVTGLPLAVAGMLCATAFVAGAGLAVLWIGVPLAVAALRWSRRMATAERARVAAVLGTPVPGPAYRTADTRTTNRQRIAVLTDPQTWRDLTHALVRFIPNTVAVSFVVTWWAGVLGGATWALWGWALPDGPENRELPELLGLGDAYLTNVGFYLVAAVVLAITLPAVARGAAHLEARCARALLQPRATTPA